MTAARSARCFRAFLKLGVTSFGGPIAHLGYFRHEFVERRKWIDEAVYADLIALCQFLPGPASSQVGFSQGNPARSRTSWWAGGVVRIHDAIGRDLA
jgi:chromate transporter